MKAASTITLTPPVLEQIVAWWFQVNGPAVTITHAQVAEHFTKLCEGYGGKVPAYLVKQLGLDEVKPADQPLFDLDADPASPASQMAAVPPYLPHHSWAAVQVQFSQNSGNTVTPYVISSKALELHAALQELRAKLHPQPKTSPGYKNTQEWLEQDALKEGKKHAGR